MLTITIPAKASSELWDEEKQEFVLTKAVKAQTLELEHSLVSLSKWESKWHKPFIGNNDKSADETIDYIRCMTLTKNVNPEVYDNLSNENVNEINAYINDPMTATTVSNVRKNKPSREIITSEILYYNMIALNIPVEFQKWHLNRLITLIEVCSEKNQPPKKMNKGDIMRRNASLNAARRSRLNSHG